MPETGFDALDDLAKAGVIVGLIGGLLAGARGLETLAVARPGWQAGLWTALLATTVILGVVMSLRDWEAVGGVVVGAAGLTLAIVGPADAGLLALVGGVLVWFGAGRRHAREAEPGQHVESVEG